MIQLIIDSTTDIPEEFFQKHDIKIIPLIVSVNGQSYRDRYEIKIDALYTEMRKGIVPKTSLPNMEEMESVFRQSCAEGKDILFIAFSSAMSGTCQAAHIIAEDLLEEYPERQILIVDSMGGCIATGLIAMQAQLWIEDGLTGDALLSHVLEMREHIQHLFTVANLDWLAKGGRVQKQVGIVGDKLNVKPILHVRDGSMHVFTFARGRKKTLDKLVDILAERSRAFPRQVIGIAHADDFESALYIKQMIQERLPESKTFICEIGCILGTHLGIGGVGLFFLNDAVPDYTLYDVLDTEAL